MTHGKNRVFDPFEFDASPFAPIGGMRGVTRYGRSQWLQASLRADKADDRDARATGRGAIRRTTKSQRAPSNP